MVRLQNVLKASLQDVLKMSWRLIAGRLEIVLKTSWRRLCKTSWRCLEDVLKMPWRRILQDVFKTYGQSEYIGLDQDILKTSSADKWLRRIYSSWSIHLEDVFKMSSEDKDKRRLQGAFIKRNVLLGNYYTKNKKKLH